MPNKYRNIEKIAQYNRENGTNFYTMEQVEQHKKDNNPSFIKKIGNIAVQVPVTSGVLTAAPTSLSSIPKVESTVGRELGYAMGLLTSPMILGELGTYGPAVGGLRLAAGSAGATGGSYITGKVGDLGDRVFKTNFLGDTGRILGGFIGFGAGMKATTPLLRKAATKGITLHMPEETFTRLRREGFHKQYEKTSREPLLDTNSLKEKVSSLRTKGPTKNYIAD